jgi:hypothetical protein
MSRSPVNPSRAHLLRRLSLLGASILLSATLGCASNSGMLKQRIAQLPEENRSYIVGTFVVTCKIFPDDCLPYFNRTSALYRDRSAHDHWQALTYEWGGVFGQDTKPDFVDRERKEIGFHFCEPLPVGDYEFYALSHYNFAGGGSGFFTSKDNQFSLPFTVAPEEVVRIGRLTVTASEGRTLIGIPASAPGALVLSRDAEQAREAAVSKCPPQVRTRAVRESPLTLLQLGKNPWVRAAEN